MKHPHYSILHEGLSRLGRPLPETTETRMLAYLELLAKWNNKFNLTAVRKIPDMLTRHVLDCMAVVPYVCGRRILDVGTGAGLPGLILAMARPDWHCVLLDSHAKKTRFVTQAVMELELSNVEVVCGRVEAYRPETPFSTVISRAFSNLREFYGQSARLCARDGCLLAMKGVNPLAELEEIASLSLSPEVYSLDVPGLGAERHLVKISINQIVIDNI